MLRYCYVFFSGLILYYDMILYHSHPHCNFGTIYWGDTRDGIKVISILSLGNSLGVGNPMEGFFLLSQPIKRIQGWCKESGAGLACPVLQTTSDLSSNAGGSEPEEMDQATIYQWDFIGQDQTWPVIRKFHGDHPMKPDFISTINIYQQDLISMISGDNDWISRYFPGI